MAAGDIVLVTGGTGAIGVPLLEALVRDGRVVAALTRRRGAVSLPAGVRRVDGDIEHGESLGMDPATLEELRPHVRTIVHAAALTRFDASLAAARTVNVEGTRNVLDFAERCGRLTSVCVLSTVYVAGTRTGTIDEAGLESGQDFVNAYERSKYEAERLLRERMSGLPLSVCRLSTAIGDSATGKVYRLAAIHHAIRFLYHSLLPMMPGTPASPVDLIATDYAVDAVRHLSTTGFIPGRTCHVCAGADAPGEQDLIDLVVEAFVRYRPVWRRRAIEKPTIVSLETFDLFRRSVEAVADSALRASVSVLASFAPQLAYPKMFADDGCRAALAGAGITRPPIRDTMMNVVKFLVDTQWTGEPV